MRRHLRRNPWGGHGVRTPKAKEFRPVRLHQPLPRPRRAKYVPAAGRFQATRLEDFEVLIERPPQRRRAAHVEPALARALVGKPGGGVFGGINQKEKFVLVDEPDGKVVGKALFKPDIGEQAWPWESYGIPTGEQYIREAVADTLDELFGWNVVPPTEIRVANFRGKDEVGSLQQWMDGRMYVIDPRKDEDDIFRMALLDVVMMNRDRHSGNMLRVDNDLWAIDNGLSMGSLPGLRNEGWSGKSGAVIPAQVMQDFRDIEEGDLRAALAPIGDRDAIDEAVARWKWMKGRDTLPTNTEFTYFMFQWMLDNLPKPELEKRKKMIVEAYNDHNGYSQLINKFGKKAYPEDYCEECRGAHMGSAGRHEREKREREERVAREAEELRERNRRRAEELKREGERRIEDIRAAARKRGHFTAEELKQLNRFEEGFPFCAACKQFHPL